MDKNSYALGMSIAHNMLQSGVREISFDDFTAGLKAALTGAETAITYEEAGTLLDEFFGKIQAEQAARQAEIGEFMKKDGETFLAANAKKEGVTVLPSGLQYKVLKSGEGRKPGRTDKVRCHYEGTFPNGQKFDSSYDRNEPAVFGVNQVIAGWTEALQLMSEGSAWELYIPYNLLTERLGLRVPSLLIPLLCSRLNLLKYCRKSAYFTIFAGTGFFIPK